MEKFIQKIMLAFACFSLGVGIAVSPITASAENIPETSIEEVIPGTSVPEEETPVVDDSSELSEKEEVTPTFEDFLAWVEEVVAKEYGFEYDFAGAVEAIKTAATQKQVTLSTIASVGFAAIALALAIISYVREKGFKAAIVKLAKELDKKVDNNIKGTNALIDGENTIIDGETENGKTAKQTQEEVQSLKRCMTAFLNAFLRFTDGVKLGDNKKTEVQSNLLSALKEISTSEGVANETDEK